MKSLFGMVVGACVLVVLGVPAGAIPGGKNDAKVTDKDVVAAANFAVKAEQAVLKKEGKTETLALVKILAAQKQVVAGLNYFLTLQVKLGDKTMTAEAVVYERAWEHKIELTSWKFIENSDAR